MVLYECLYNLKKRIKKVYFHFLPDRVYLKKLYKQKLNLDLNLKKPTMYAEKLNWLKLYDRQPKYTMLADKYSVREYVADTIGAQYLIPLIACWERVDQIDFSQLPNEFVLKCNHGNGVVICKDKRECSIDEIKCELLCQYKKNLYKAGREWVYKNISKKIVCERYMTNGIDEDLIDYKFYCFNGKAKVVCIICNRTSEMTLNFFDMEFNRLDIKVKGGNCSSSEIIKPQDFEKMIKIAEALSRDIPHVRVDLYNINQHIYFGEMTFYDDAGFIWFEPDSWNKTFGDWIILPSKKH